MLVEFVVDARFDPDHIGTGRRGDLKRTSGERVG